MLSYTPDNQVLVGYLLEIGDGGVIVAFKNKIERHICPYREHNPNEQNEPDRFGDFIVQNEFLKSLLRCKYSLLILPGQTLDLFPQNLSLSLIIKLT